MRIAIDVMGGDHAPLQIIAGALQAANWDATREMILVGQKAILDQFGELPANVHCHYAEQVMAMDESVENLVKKKDSSIWQATSLVKQGQADAVISAGSTAAQMACAVLLLGRPKGVERPAIATVLPTMQGGKLLLDIGANADCTPQMLCQFARMGAIYAEKLLRLPNPRVALLSNGTEAHKGNQLVQATFPLLAASGLNFIGNLEGRDVLTGNYEVLVADGFSGNLVLKSIEGTAGMIMGLLKTELTASLPRKLGAALIKPGLKVIKQKMDYKEYGGAPLLGVKGISIICHGSSDAGTICAAVRVAENCQKSGFVAAINEQIQAPSDA